MVHVVNNHFYSGATNKKTMSYTQAYNLNIDLIGLGSSLWAMYQSSQLVHSQPRTRHLGLIRRSAISRSSHHPTPGRGSMMQGSR
jgi:hypothetical protein